MARRGNLNHLAALRRLLVDAAAQGVAPVLELAVWGDGQLWEVRSHDGPAARFDLASLTKPLATGLIALTLAAEGRLVLDRPLPSGETPRQLLDHSAGYPAWAPLFGPLLTLPAAERRSRMAEAASRLAPAWAPGEATVYSDLGFLRLGRLLEELGGAALDHLFSQRVANPLGLSLEFNDLASDNRLPAAPTGTTRPRPPAPGQAPLLAGVVYREVGARLGEVDDDNAWALAGVAGHAGLMGTVRAVALAGARFLEELAGASRLAPPALVRAFTAPSPLRGGPGTRALAWDLPSAPSSLGTRWGRGPLGAIGHLGFTGCSLWIDLDQRVSIALCSNRVWWGRANQQIRDLRPRLHDAVAGLLGLA